MKINVASFGGRTHMLDTARELERNGHDVKFYSFVPTSRAMKFGLKPECNKSYFMLALPFLALQKMTKRSFWSQYIFQFFFDLYVGLIMSKCDVFIGQSPMHIFAIKSAKRRFKAITILERGSSHILIMSKIFQEIEGNKNKLLMPTYFIKRDLKGYELADYISIASDFQKRGFLEHGIQSSKILINMYGTSLSQFHPTSYPVDNVFDVIMVGNWCYRKGCDLIIEAVKKINISFLHIGSVGDLEFPLEDNFSHIDTVDQKDLINYYKRAKVFVLPSREDGFGMVLSQAVACGLPIVCSKNTGGPDLKRLFDNTEWIIEMEDYSSDCLANSLLVALELSEKQKKDNVRDYVGDRIHDFTWEAYGKRYQENLNKILKN